MPDVEVFIGVTVKHDDGSVDKHSLTGTARDAHEPIPATAATGMKVLKQLLTEMRAKS